MQEENEVGEEERVRYFDSDSDSDSDDDDEFN